MLEEIYDIFKRTVHGEGDSDRHALTLLSIALSLKAKRILELGVRHGNTTMPLLIAAAENGGKLDSVDKNETPFICPDKFKKNYQFHNCDVFNFLEKASYGPPYDLVYLDDWHSYSHVRAELAFLDMMVSCKGIILIHDLMYSTEPYYHCDMAVKTGQWADGGPYKAVAELDQNFWEFATIPVNNGLTILRKKYSSRYHKI